MFSLAVVLFLSGILTILLPCILPLLPIVLGVSIAGGNRLRPFMTVLGMVVSFVGFTFFVQVFLAGFAVLADIIRIGTFHVLLLFGLGFLTERRDVRLIGAALGGIFFIQYGWLAALAGAVFGLVAMEVGGRVAPRLQQLGTDVQTDARQALGADSALTAFIVGLTLGLVWAPCAGPALGFVLILIRDRSGADAFLLLLAYACGAALPLLLVGYGGQFASRSVRSLTKLTGVIKRVAGTLLILTAVALRLDLFTGLQVWLADSSLSAFGNRIEDELFEAVRPGPTRPDGAASLPVLGMAPSIAGLGEWFNSEPLTDADLKGKVVLVDFWTYSCINCIRTLPYIQGYWEKYESGPFVLLGIHAPEFAFEQVPANVEAAVERYGLTYPVAQDNDFTVWRAFSNHYWPAKYLIDAHGRIRYTHFGEGGYDETDRAIAELLTEAGVTMSGAVAAEPARGQRRPITAETYVNERGWRFLRNGSLLPTDDVVEYELPESLREGEYALGGTWQMMDGERQVLVSDEGSLRLQALAGEINLVLGPEDDDRPSTVTVIIDGEETSRFTVDHDDLYPLFRGEYGEHDVLLEFRGGGVGAYAFTFGEGG